MSESNFIGRLPSFRQLESPTPSPVESKAKPTSPVAPGSAAVREGAAGEVAGKDLGSRSVAQGDASRSASPVASVSLPTLAPHDGESLNVLVMALASAAKTEKLTPPKIGRLVEHVLTTQVNPQRQARQLPALALDADTLAHLVRRVGKNARQFFPSAEPRLGDFQNYQTVMDWAASQLLDNGGLLNYGMFRQAILEGLPAGAGPFGGLERGWLDTGIRTLLKAMDGASREADEVLDDARALFALAGHDAHPQWLETAMIAVTAGDRPVAAQPHRQAAGKAPAVPLPDAKHAPGAGEDAPGQAQAFKAESDRALERLLQPLRRQEQLIRAALAWNPEASPQQLFGVFRGLGRGLLMARLIEDTDLGPLMHSLVHRGLRRGMSSPDQLPAMIAGLAEGLRDAHPKKAKALGGKLNERLAQAVVAGGGKVLGDFAREIAQHSLKPDFAARQGYLGALRAAQYEPHAQGNQADGKTDGKK